jgi:RNA polymerase sigma factor (sigma-70 family)
MEVLPERAASAEVWLGSPALPGLVARVAARYGIGSDDLQDLVQETRIALWRAGAGAPVGAAWVARVAMHKAVDFVRQRARIRACLQTIACLTEPRWEEPDLERLLMAQVAELPIPVRQFYELHYEQGWSEREIATRLGKCRASVRWLDHCFRRAVIDRRPPAVVRRRGRHKSEGAVR